MGDRATLAKAKKDLEELYLGVPDDSVNLTFQHLANIPQRDPDKTMSTTSPIMQSISERSDHKPSTPAKSFAKLPSLDFSRGLESTLQSHVLHHHQQQRTSHHKTMEGGDMWGPHGHAYDMSGPHGRHGDRQKSVAYDDMSHVSGVSTVYGAERGGRRRPGIPHSNICTVCCNYIYICRHRCLVCGRVYCRQCVNIGMGEMSEGRKCIECLGRRFSQRYIKKAGSIGCCMGYSSGIKQQELKWAERGPRRSGENRYNSNHSVMVSRARSPISSPSPSMMHSPRNLPSSVLNSPSTMHSLSNPPSFVLNSPYSSRNPQFMPL